MRMAQKVKSRTAVELNYQSCRGWSDVKIVSDARWRGPARKIEKLMK